METDERDIARATSPWALYDEMIDGVPEGIAVTDFCVGRSWTYVEAACGMGVSHTVVGGTPRDRGADPLGMDLRSLAGLSKSWSFVEASLGVAALNAWYATPEKVSALGGEVSPAGAPSGERNPFLDMREACKGKRVMVVGHFPGLRPLAESCRLTVLERDCSDPLDTPDPACEYLVPEADLLFMTGITLTNKTAPRLLELGRDAITVVVGPSAVPCLALFGHGANVVAGSVVVDAAQAKLAVKGGTKAQWRAGIRKFELRRPA